MSRYKDYRGLTQADRDWLERFDRNERGQFFDDGRDLITDQEERCKVWSRDYERRYDAMSNNPVLISHLPDGPGMKDPLDGWLTIMQFDPQMEQVPFWLEALQHGNFPKERKPTIRSLIGFLKSLHEGFAATKNTVRG